MVGPLLGNGMGEFKPVSTEVCLRFSFLTVQTRSLGNTVTQNMVAAPFFSVLIVKVINFMLNSAVLVS